MRQRERAWVILAAALVACGGSSAHTPDAGMDAGPPPLGAVACDDPAHTGVAFCLANQAAKLPSYRNDSYGTGMAALDADGDGDLDLFLAGDAYPSHFLRNQGDGTFVEDTQAVGLSGLRKVHGATVGDFDNDGRPDLYLTREGGARLYHNTGTGFVDVTAAAGVGNTGFGSGAAFGDYDGDGLLDLYVGNWVDVLSGGQPQPNALYHNEGNGTFKEVAVTLGVSGSAATQAVLLTDFDGDGDLDLMVAHDFGFLTLPNRMFRNDGPGAPWKLTEVSQSLGLDQAMFAMNLSACDYNRDGALDYYITNIGCNVLAEQRPGGLGFVDVARARGVAVCDTVDPSVRFTYQAADPQSPDAETREIAAYQVRYVADPSHPALTSWAGVFFDADQDGWEDLFVANGPTHNDPRIYQEAAAQPNALLLNVTDPAGGRRFQDVSAGSGVASAQNSRSALAFDYDGDGDLDLAVSQLELGGPQVPSFLLYRNQMARGHWLIVDLEGGARDALPGTRANRSGIGARVEVAIAGQPQEVRERSGGGGFLSDPSPQLHFGLGTATRVDTVLVRWPAPSKTVDICRDLAVDRHLVVHEGDCPP